MTGPDRAAAGHPPAPAVAQLRAFIREHAVVRGPVVLSSGATADWYADLRQATLSGTAARRLGPAMLDLTEEWEYESVGGLTSGADPVALAMAIAAADRGRRLDAFIVRKEAKRHGLQRRIEGPPISGRRVLVVEDVSTTGSSALTAVRAAREAGAVVVGVAAVLDRGGSVAIAAAGLGVRSLLQPTDLDA